MFFSEDDSEVASEEATSDVLGLVVEFTATDCGATVAAVDVVVDEDVEVDVWVADPRLMCRFFLAISALSTVPFS